MTGDRERSSDAETDQLVARIVEAASRSAPEPLPLPPDIETTVQLIGAEIHARLLQGTPHERISRQMVADRLGINRDLMDRRLRRWLENHNILRTSRVWRLFCAYVDEHREDFPKIETERSSLPQD
jgi:hypothetical protein